MPDDHYSVGVAMTPAFVPAVIAMFAELGARVVAAMMVAVAAAWSQRFQRWRSTALR